MRKGNKTAIPKPEGHECFACGTANPIGFNMQFFHSGNKVISEVTLGRYHVGWANISHGGIITTLLDEIMSWTILYFKRVFFLTRKIEVKYIRPVLVGSHVKIEGEIKDFNEPERVIKVKGSIRDDDGNLLAMGTGEFIALEKENLPPVLEDSKEEIFSLIDRLPPL